MKVGVIGAGAWGTALSISSASGGNAVTLWSHSAGMAKNIRKGRENSHLPRVKIPKNIVVTTEIGDLADTDVWLIATPSAFFRETIRKSRPFWKNQPIIICTKGLEVGTNKLISEIVEKEIPGIKKTGLLGVLSGPQFADDVAKGLKTGSTLAGEEKVFKAGRTALPAFYIEKSDDIVGVGICGAGKNAIALLSGYLAGSCTGENARAMIITLCWEEVMNLGRKMGAQTETSLKLCGLGDLFLCANSKTSRNFSAGIALARKESLSKNATIEGMAAVQGLTALGKKHGVKMPIMTELGLILDE